MPLFHAHVTVPVNTKCPKGWKRTEILLESKTVQQTDLMLTKHFSNTSVAEILQQIKDTCFEQNPIRVKLEQDTDFTLPISSDHYVEVHMLCVEGYQPIGEGWVTSRNLNSVGKRFHNLRIYLGPSVEEVVAPYRDINTFLEFKVEQAVFDSNRNHDKWWA